MAKAKAKNKKLNQELEKAMLGDAGSLGYEIASHWKLLLGITVGLAVLIAAFFWTAEYRQKTSRKAQHALAAAETVAELRGALAANKDSNAAPAARMKLARLLLTDKKYDEAIVELKLAASQAGSDHLGATAELHEGYALELAGKTEEAAKAFSALSVKKSAPATIKAEAAYCAGRLFAARKELKEAVAVLDMARKADRGDAGTQWNEMSLSLLRSIQAGEFGVL